MWSKNRFGGLCVLKKFAEKTNFHKYVVQKRQASFSDAYRHLIKFKISRVSPTPPGMVKFQSTPFIGCSDLKISKISEHSAFHRVEIFSVEHVPCLGTRRRVFPRDNLKVNYFRNHLAIQRW